MLWILNSAVMFTPLLYWRQLHNSAHAIYQISSTTFVKAELKKWHILISNFGQPKNPTVTQLSLQLTFKLPAGSLLFCQRQDCLDFVERCTRCSWALVYIYIYMIMICFMIILTCNCFTFLKQMTLVIHVWMPSMHSNVLDRHSFTYILHTGIYMGDICTTALH